MTKVAVQVLYAFATVAIAWAVFEFAFAFFFGDLGGTSGMPGAEQRSFDLVAHGITHLGLGVLAFGLARSLARDEG